MQLDLNSVAPLGETLRILVLGMLGIFVVTLTIILVIALLNRVTNAKKRHECPDR
jgi:hypothetical protein